MERQAYPSDISDEKWGDDRRNSPPQLQLASGFQRATLTGGSLRDYGQQVAQKVQEVTGEA